ncbi:helix-turn-helix transcriptional regulator [Agromyces allii]|uniref:AraC family transcriptional regulator n=1 Tax=Agromyces allii TaxID=393607 RepID=A0ABN2QP34_9MICO|nr:AraC family transcriptional regulator [Agromyces allii]
MCDLAERTPPGAAIDDARTIDLLMEHLRWSVLGVDHHDLPAGDLRREEHDGGRFLFVVSGAIELEHDSGVYRTGRGDFALLPRGGRFTLRAEQDSQFVGISIALLGAHPLMTHAMPPVLHSYGFGQQEPGFAALLETIHREAALRRPGAISVIAGLTDAAVSGSVRFWLEHGCGSARPWLAAAHDHHLGLALAAIHDAPGSPWTVASLARVARASRSQFAEHFRDAVGDTPARYVTRIRMTRAERMLRDGEPVSDIAYRLGYDSEDGFSRAFRRHSGVAPSRWRRAALQPAA